MTAADTIGAEAPDRSRADTTSMWSRASDLLNPILVREVQQAVKGRVFALTVFLALAVSVVIAVIVAADYAEGGTGRQAFDAGFATLVPLLVFVVPMQAYQSMRTELRGGIVEQLLLSRLSPGAVLSGKLQAAMVQFVLYVSVLSPLLATSYLLRGVDLPTIALSLAFALVVCVAATAFAVSSAAQAIVPSLQPIANLGIAFALGMATFGLVGGVVSGQYTSAVGALLRSSDFAAVVSGLTLGAAITTAMSWLAARSFLLHAFENKSTGFRVFLFLLPPVFYGWMLLFLDASNWRFAFPVLTVILVMTGILFGLFMVTEQRDLSPRVRAHVPPAGAMAVLATPFLPGRDRGLMCFTIYSALVTVVAAVAWPRSLGAYPSGMPLTLARVGSMSLAYALVYLAIGRWIRARLPDTVPGSQAGRFALPVALFLGCVLPLLVDVFTRGGVSNWHVGHIMNPLLTIQHFADRRWLQAQPVVIGVVVLALLLQVPAWVRGVREVCKASAVRRGRLAEAAAVPEDGTGDR